MYTYIYTQLGAEQGGGGAEQRRHFYTHTHTYVYVCTYIYACIYIGCRAKRWWR